MAHSKHPKTAHRIQLTITSLLLLLLYNPVNATINPAQVQKQNTNVSYINNIKQYNARKNALIETLDNLADGGNVTIIVSDTILSYAPSLCPIDWHIAPYRICIAHQIHTHADHSSPTSSSENSFYLHVELLTQQNHIQSLTYCPDISKLVFANEEQPFQQRSMYTLNLNTIDYRSTTITNMYTLSLNKANYGQIQMIGLGNCRSGTPVLNDGTLTYHNDLESIIYTLDEKNKTFNYLKKIDIYNATKTKRKTKVIHLLETNSSIWGYQDGFYLQDENGNIDQIIDPTLEENHDGLYHVMRQLPSYRKYCRFLVENPLGKCQVISIDMTKKTIDLKVTINTNTRGHKSTTCFIVKESALIICGNTYGLIEIWKFNETTNGQFTLKRINKRPIYTLIHTMSITMSHNKILMFSNQGIKLLDFQKFFKTSKEYDIEVTYIPSNIEIPQCQLITCHDGTFIAYDHSNIFKLTLHATN